MQPAAGVGFVAWPVPDLADGEVLRRIAAASERARSSSGARVSCFVGGRDTGSGTSVRSVNPARPHEIVAEVATASRGDVDAAVDAAWRAFDAWREVPDDDRSALLRRVASAMRAAQVDLAALLVLETGKSWGEALGEVAESVDFLEFHVRAWSALRERERGAVYPHPTERNLYRYLPLGAGVLLTPWPFPVAQATAMISAAVLAGNAVVLKPGSASAACARAVVDLWRDAGTPDGVVNALFGPGDEVGHWLVAHPGARFVTATGSAATGSAVFAAATAAHPGRQWFTRVALETSGKNAVFVDASADLDVAAEGIVSGAFSFQGQKCSAGSWVLADRSIRAALVDRIVERAAGLVIGDPMDPRVDFGPVIDDAAVARFLGAVAVGRHEGRLACGGGAIEGTGHFVQPTVIDHVPAHGWSTRHELLVPLLAVVDVDGPDEAFRLIAERPYGLTGSCYANDERVLDRAVKRFKAGSLYLNRKPTASEVGFHPFGGFGLSGTDAKAGGPDYLLQYVQAQVVTRASP